MADPLRHRQTKGAATDMVDLTPPRHIPTLPNSADPDGYRERQVCGQRRSISGAAIIPAEKPSWDLDRKPSAKKHF